MSELNTEEKILQAAQIVFSKTGFSGARMDDIAKEAGINRALLHYYFRSKDKLFELVFHKNFMEFVEGIMNINFSNMDLFSKIEAIVNHQIDSNIKNPNLASFILHEFNTNPDVLLNMAKNKTNGLDKLFKAFEKSVEEAYQQNLIEKTDARHLWMNMVSMSMFPFVGKPILSEAFSLNQKNFIKLMEERKKIIPAFIIQSIKKIDSNEK
jgi:AcrR family transcriptional regulator